MLTKDFFEIFRNKKIKNMYLFIFILKNLKKSFFLTFQSKYPPCITLYTSLRIRIVTIVI